MKDIAHSADGVPVRYEVRGTGTPTLVFVHGWSCDRSYWRAQTDVFARHYQVVTIDLAGHGESGSDRRAWTMPAFGADVVAVVERLGLQSTVLIGHSMGGDVIVEAALQLSNRVVGLVWVDVYTTLDTPPNAEQLQEFIAPFRNDFAAATRDFVRRLFAPDSDPALVDWVAADMSAAPPEIALEAMQHARSNMSTAAAGLRRLDVPKVAINPEQRPTDVESLQRHGMETTLVSGVRHFPMMEDAETFNRALRETIERFTDQAERRPPSSQ